MNGANVAGTNLDGFHLTPVMHRRGKDEVPEEVRPVSGQREWFVRRDDQVRRAELPSGCEDGKRRRVHGRAFGRTGTDPLFDGCDLRLREPALTRKVTEAP